MEWTKLLSARRLYQNHDQKIENNPIRSHFDSDYDRIIFSSPFRNLQDKTQVIPLPEDAFVHNRLTHSLEVASVGRSLGREVGYQILKKHPSLKDQHISVADFGSIVASACLAHDIGNPSFGHSGEKAISNFFILHPEIKDEFQLTDLEWNDLVNFEGNANGFHALVNGAGSIEHGIRLTEATLGAFFKYPKGSVKLKNRDSVNEKKYGYFQVNKKAFEKLMTNLEISYYEKENQRIYHRHPLVYLTEAADDICYSIIDFEDGLRLGWIDFNEGVNILKEIIGEKLYEKRFNEIPSKDEKIGYLRANIIGLLIEDLASIFINNEEKFLDGSFSNSLIDSSRYIKGLDKIKKLSINNVYKHHSVIELEAAGFTIIENLLEKFINAILNQHRDKLDYQSGKMLELLPNKFHCKNETIYIQMIRVCEYISSLTDRMAFNLYQKLNGIKI